MKQFFFCMVFSFIFYVLCSVLGLSFNPMKWSNQEGRYWFVIVEFMIWFIPVFWNVIEGEKNFE